MKNPMYHQASLNPVAVIESLSRRPDQHPRMRMYKAGFEDYLDMMPTLSPDDDMLALKVDLSGRIMQDLAARLKGPTAPTWVRNDLPIAKEFQRHIIAVEDPVHEVQLDGMDQEMATIFINDRLNMPDAWQASMRDARAKFKASLVNETILKEGSELLIAQWGPGFSSPIHGHAPGLLHEEILFGKLMVNVFRHHGNDTVRPIRSDIVGEGTLVSEYSAPDARHGRWGLVHNFTAIEPSGTLHFVPEHTRDGRDNQFEVEYFERHGSFTKDDFQQLNRDERMQLKVGDVALVRSANVPEYGDHWIVIVGPHVLKPWGLRPDDVAISAPGASHILDQYSPCQMGVTLLKLDESLVDEFYAFHGISNQGGKIVFPKP